MIDHASNMTGGHAHGDAASRERFDWLAALRSPRIAGWVKLGSFAVIVLSLLLLARLLPVERAVQAMAAWVEGAGVWGPITFILLYIVFTVFMLPGWILTVTAGALFGLLWGTVAVSIGSTLGVAAAFLIARYLARNMVERKLSGYPRFAAVDRAVGEGGWKIVALLRLSPAVPFNVQNYLYGLTAIRFWPVVLASWAAMLPGTFLYVYLGYAGRAGLEAAAGAEAERGIGQWLLLGVGLVATVVVTVYVTKLARRAIQRQQGAAEEIAKMEERRPEEAKAPERASLLGTLMLAGLALVILVGTACAYLNADRIRGAFGGPPAVLLAEEYEPRPDSPDIDHSAFDAILKRYVNNDGGVDYAGLIANPDPLWRYNASLAQAPFDEMGRDEKLALLINAYNSFTLQLMAEWLPREEIEGIRDIPAAQRWDDERWNVGGHVWSLNQIEHEQVRPKFIEPDVHWALVCAAVGCPPLRTEAYVADRLEEQLREQARTVHTDGTRWFRYDRSAGVVHLTPLYNWYGGDFEQVAGSALAYAARYAADLRTDLERGREPRIAWLEYDWSPNDQENLPGR